MATNLVALMKRLESAIERLEGVVGNPASSPAGSSPAGNSPAGSNPAGSPVPRPPADSPLVAAYTAQVMAKLPSLLQTAEGVGGVCTEAVSANQSQAFVSGFEFSFRLLKLSEKCKKPTPDELRALVAPPIQQLIAKVAKVKDKQSPLYNHVAAVSEGIQSVQWPVVVRTMQDGPLALVQTYLDGANFTGNKVLMAKCSLHRNPPHVAWYKALKEILTSLAAFLEEHCKTGLLWKGTGAAFSVEFSGVPNAPALPPLPAVPKEETKSTPPPAPQAPAKRPPKKYEQGVSWVIQDYENDQTLEIKEEEAGRMKGVMLDRLVNCSVAIKGKVKNILINGCRKLNVTCQSVVASTEIVACKSVKVQTTGILPSISIDGSDGVQVFLNPESKAECVFATSKSSDMTVNFLREGSTDDWMEVPIPHQFTHRIAGDRVNSEVSDLYR